MWSTKPRTDSPPKTSWFEFLLDQTLLSKHLEHDSPDPSATELIVSFLSNCSILANDQSNGNNNSNGKLPVFGPSNIYEDSCPEEIEIKDESEIDCKKSRALKLLSLKVATFLKWDLHLLRKKLPLHMQEALLFELLKITGNEVVEKNILLKNGIDKLNPDAMFACILFCIWILQAVVEDSSSPKNQKGTTVQIPGQVDPAAISTVVIENIMKKLNEQKDDATVTLEDYIQSPQPVRMALLKCFNNYLDEKDSAPKWEEGLILPQDEIVCQVSYSLGRFYFFHEEYEKASNHFIRASELYQKCQSLTFCKLDTTKLTGFYNACANLIGYHTSGPTSLKESVFNSMSSGHFNTISLLKTDNIKKELRISLRDAVEMNVLQDHFNNLELTLYVIFSNAIRRVVNGMTVMSDCYTLLKTHEDKSSIILCDLLKDAIPTCNARQKLFLTNFIKVVCLTSSPTKLLLKKKGCFNHLTSESFIKEESELFSTPERPTTKRDFFKPERNFTNDFIVQVGLYERRLLSATDPSSIKSLVIQLRNKFRRTNICMLNKKWDFPEYVKIFLSNVPPHLLNLIDLEMVQILIAKCNELRVIKKYSDAQNVCQRIDNEIRNNIPRLSCFLNWDRLHLSLSEILETPSFVCQTSSYRTEIVQRILQFLNWIKDRSDCPEIVMLELCAAVLLNFREWDKIIELGYGMGCYFEFSRLVSFICKEIFLNKGNRTSCKDLWNVILPMFFNPNAQKRTSSGIIKDNVYEHVQPIMNRLALQSFTKKLKDTSSLGVVISCLAQFYNILKDDSTGEIFLEYSGLWPTNVPNPSAFNMTAVGDAFQTALNHALSVHPTHSAWLRTKGDVFYVQGSYATALRYYISVAMVCTDYFYQSLPKVLFDDMMLKHMINCCTKLSCFTQSAVLYQFLEESNYQGAFKSLTERACYDSCDSYYSCIWDVTLLEFLIYLHSKRSEFDYQHLALQMIGQLELNANNNDEIQREAANLRRGRFLRAMAKQYL